MKDILEIVDCWKNKEENVYGYESDYKYISNITDYHQAGVDYVFCFNTLNDLVRAYNNYYAANIDIADVEKLIILL